MSANDSRPPKPAPSRPPEKIFHGATMDEVIKAAKTIATLGLLTQDDERHHKKSLADEATEIIYGDREKTHGDPARNLEAIAQMWSAITGIAITPPQVCLMMIALKLARASNDTSHRDHWLDAVGYALLAERCGYVDEPKEENQQ